MIKIKIEANKKDEDIIEKLKGIAKKINAGKKRKPLNAKQMKQIFYEQYERRAEMIGDNIQR